MVTVVISIANGFVVPVLGANIDNAIGSHASTLELDKVQCEFVFELVIRVVDAYNYSLYLENAVFSLYTTEQPTDDSGDPLTGLTTREHEGDPLYLISDALRSNEFGIVRCLRENNDDINIGAGTFYLFETEAPAGYYLMDEPIRFTLVPRIESNNLLGLVVESPSTYFTYNYQAGIIATVVESTACNWPLGHPQGVSVSMPLIVLVVLVVLGLFAGATKQGHTH